MPTTHENLARLRLSQIVQELIEHEKSFEKLAERIAEANLQTNHGKVDRRKLSSLAKGDSVNLSFDELDALNRFLIQERGVGLGSIFPTPTITEALTAKGKVTFLLGAKHGGGRTALSVWDFRCMEWMARRIYRAAPMTQVDFLDVPLPLQGPSALPPSGQAAAREIDNWEALLNDPHSPSLNWEALLNDPRGPSLICFGTQRACWATEFLLRKMFNIDWIPPAERNGTRSPFAFIWSPAQPDEYDSSFSTCPSAIQDDGWRVDSKGAKGWQTWGIHLREPISVSGLGSNTLKTTLKTLKVQRQGVNWSSFGAIVAQRRPHGQVWLCLMGLSGPETFAGAKVVDSVIKALPASDGHAPAPVLWALFEAAVQENLLEMTGDNRRLVSQRLLLQDYWPSGVTERA